MTFKSTIVILLFALLCLLGHVSAKTPVGAVRVDLQYGEELPDKDPGADLSDPYVKLWVDGNPKQKSKVVHNDLDPTFYQTFYFLLYPGFQNLHFEVRDRDPGHKHDDLLGRSVINLNGFCKPAPTSCSDTAFAVLD
ncbi:5546_t:CDS:2, partial [Paraglomus occultum]